MLPQIRLDRDAKLTLHEQLANWLRRLILTGEMPPGFRLPSSRRLAEDLDVSRNVVVLAYEQLRLEGYLSARVGSGTRVPESLPGHLLSPDPVDADEAGDGAGLAPRLSRHVPWRLPVKRSISWCASTANSPSGRRETPAITVIGGRLAEHPARNDTERVVVVLGQPGVAGEVARWRRRTKPLGDLRHVRAQVEAPVTVGPVRLSGMSWPASSTLSRPACKVHLAILPRPIAEATSR